MQHTTVKLTKQSYDSIDEQFQEKTHAIINKVHRTLAEKTWSINQFAEVMEKTPSEVTYWLSGFHNLTLKNIILMEATLGVDLIHCVPSAETEFGILNQTTQKKIALAIKDYKQTHDTSINHEKIWLERYLCLIDFIRKNGHANIPNRPDDKFKMNKWIVKNRHMHNHGELDPDRADLLKLINFNFRLSSIHDWDKMYKMLKDYKAKHGHLNVPKYPRKLSSWIHYQRKVYWSGKLEYSKLKQLKEIGLDLKSHKLDYWEEMYDKLVEYKKKNGHINMSKNYGADKRLVTFVALQRQAKKKNKILPEHEQLLDKIGFIWNPGTELRTQMLRQYGYKQWLKRLEELKAYKKEYGTSYISTTSATHKSLGVWAASQRRNWKSLSPEKIEKLKEVDFFKDYGIEENV